MKYVAVLFILLYWLLFSLLDVVGSDVKKAILLVEEDLPLNSSSALPLTPHPINCNPNQEYSIQIVWAYSIADAGTVVQVDIVERQTRLAEQVNGLFIRSSNSYTEAKMPAWKVKPDCQLDILYTPLEFNLPLQAKTKYLIVEPKTDYCGKASIFDDDQPTQNNLNNLASLMWVSTGCQNYYIYAHEIVHSLGGLQHSAPNSNGGFHAIDFGDVMASPIKIVCPGHDNVDCSNDDYFSGRVFSGTYLESHWNIWNSPYLIPVPKYTVILPLANFEGNYGEN